MKRSVLLVVFVVFFVFSSSMTISSTSFDVFLSSYSFLDGKGNYLNNGYILNSSADTNKTFNLPLSTSRVFEQYSLGMKESAFSNCSEAIDKTRLVRVRTFRDEDNNLTKEYQTIYYPDDCDRISSVNRFILTFPQASQVDGLQVNVKDYLIEPVAGDDFIEYNDWIKIEYKIQVKG